MTKDGEDSLRPRLPKDGESLRPRPPKDGEDSLRPRLPKDGEERHPRELSAPAALLLATLRRHGAVRRSAALTDARLAQITGIPQREIIDYARELIDARYPVCATCKSPMGRFLVEPRDADAMREARAEIEVLESRGRDNFSRANALKKCLDLFDQGMFPVDSKGQQTLFESASPPHERRAAQYGEDSLRLDPGRFTR